MTQSMVYLVFILVLEFGITVANAQLRPPQVNAVYSAATDAQNDRDARALKRLAPGLSTLRDANSKFLKQKKTGILFFSVKQPCAFEISKNKNEIRVMSNDDLERIAKECPARNFRGETQHFSFRLKRYVPSEQADLSYNGNALYSNGMFGNSVLATLGNVPIEELDLDSKGMSGLRDIVPAKNPVEADDRQKMIEKGFVVGDIPYSRGVVPTVNTTYALRVIAYNVPFEKVNTYLGNGKTSSPLFGDERADIIVAYRIIAIDPSGITVIWKELQRKSSPFLRSDNQ